MWLKRPFTWHLLLQIHFERLTWCLFYCFWHWNLRNSIIGDLMKLGQRLFNLAQKTRAWNMSVTETVIVPELHVGNKITMKSLVVNEETLLAGKIRWWSHIPVTGPKPAWSNIAAATAVQLCVFVCLTLSQQIRSSGRTVSQQRREPRWSRWLSLKWRMAQRDTKCCVRQTN